MIETERLLLRPPEPADVDAVFRFVSDPQVMRWIGTDGEIGTREDAVARVELYRRAWRIDGFGPFMVVRKDSGATVGRVGLLVWDPRTWRTGTRLELGEHAEVELGWTLERAAWRHGFATEAAAAVAGWAFRELAPPRLISLIHAENVRSLAVARRLGERHERDVVTDRGATVQLWSLRSRSV